MSVNDHSKYYRPKEEGDVTVQTPRAHGIRKHRAKSRTPMPKLATLRAQPPKQPRAASRQPERTPQDRENRLQPSDETQELRACLAQSENQLAATRAELSRLVLVAERTRGPTEPDEVADHLLNVFRENSCKTILSLRDDLLSRDKEIEKLREANRASESARTEAQEIVRALLRGHRLTLTLVAQNLARFVELAIAGSRETSTDHFEAEVRSWLQNAQLSELIDILSCPSIPNDPD